MIIFKYIAKQILGTTVALSFVLLLVILSGRFIKYLGSVASGEMAANILSSLMLYRLPGFLELILPLGFFIATLLVYGRLYVESEMVVMLSGGFSRNRLLSFTLLIALFAACIVGLISCFLTPIGVKKFDQIWDDPNNFRGLNTMVEGRFQSNQGTRWISYTEELSADKSSLGLVFMAHPATSDNAKEILVIAKNGHVSKLNQRRFLELNDGYRYEGNPGELDYQVTKFQQYGQLIEASSTHEAVSKPESMATFALWQADNAQSNAIFHWRISVPISLLIMSVLAFAMSQTSSRRGRFVKVFPAIILYITYIFLLSAGKNYLAEEKIPQWVGLWWIHAIFLMLVLITYFELFDRFINMLTKKQTLLAD